MSIAFTVRVGPAARRVIEDALFERRDELVSGETGGFLYAITQWPSGLEIIGASAGSGTRPDADGRGALLDRDECYAVEGKLRSVYDVTGRMVAGSWHTHPVAYVPEPSAADRDHWLSIFDALSKRGWRGRIVGLIIGCDYHATFFNPVYRAFTVYRQPHDGQPVCEPAEVT